MIELPVPHMSSGDYAWFAERVPSAHLMIESRIDERDTAVHRSDYPLNENVIPIGTKLLAGAVLELIGAHS